MSRIELGAVGVVVGAGRGHDLVDTAVQLEAMGYPTIWLTGGPITALDQIAAVARATRRARIASGIISVDRFPADDVSALYAELESGYPGRFVVGLGGAHGANPLATLGDYLDRLGSQPPRCRGLRGLWRPEGLACSTWPGSGRRVHSRCWWPSVGQVYELD